MSNFPLRRRTDKPLRLSSSKPPSKLLNEQYWRLPAFLTKGDRLAGAVDAGQAYDIEARHELSVDLRREFRGMRALPGNVVER